MVTSDTRGPGFESSHWQLLLNIYLLLTVCRKDENKEKEAGNGPFFKKTVNRKQLFFEIWHLLDSNPWCSVVGEDSSFNCARATAQIDKDKLP